MRVKFHFTVNKTYVIISHFNKQELNFLAAFNSALWSAQTKRHVLRLPPSFLLSYLNDFFL